MTSWFVWFVQQSRMPPENKPNTNPKLKEKLNWPPHPPPHSCLFAHLASFTTHPHVSNRDICTQIYIFFYMSRKFMRKVCQEILNLQAVSIIYHPYYIQIYRYIYTSLLSSVRCFPFGKCKTRTQPNLLLSIYIFRMSFDCLFLVSILAAFVSLFSLFLLTKFLVAGGIKCEDKLWFKL